MNLQLEGRAAIITGGSLGIGRAIAEAFAREGMSVALLARSVGPLEQAAAEITAATGARVLPVPADVSDTAAVDARARPHLDDVVGGADRVLVVLDHDDSVADVAQPLERRDHLHVVFRMKADARLVEHIEHPHQA